MSGKGAHRQARRSGRLTLEDDEGEVEVAANDARPEEETVRVSIRDLEKEACSRISTFIEEDRILEKKFAHHILGERVSERIKNRVGERNGRVLAGKGSEAEASAIATQRRRDGEDI